MTFLARKASLYVVKGTAEDGLKLLSDAKSQADRIVPCKDTAMVVYMETNLMVKDYEHEPSEEKKYRIIQKMKEAIKVHCNEEYLEVKENCCSTFYVRIALFYLGLGVMGNNMVQCHVTSSDLKSAECVLDRLEDSPVPMDAYRKMCYNLARSVLCQHSGKKEKALYFGENARQIAERSQFMLELDNIKPSTRDLAIELKQMTTMKGDGILQEFKDIHQGGELR